MTSLRLILRIKGQHGTEHLIDAPRDLTTEDFISQVVEDFNLTSIAEHGRGAEWELRDESGNTLDERKTLQQNGIVTNQRLLLLHYKSGSDIQLHIRNKEDGKEHIIDCPVDLKVVDFLAELIDGLQLSSGAWVLDDEETGMRLDPQGTLNNNRVRSGHHLRLHRDGVEPELPPMKARLEEIEEEEEDLQKSPDEPPMKPDEHQEKGRGFQDANVRFTTYCPKYIPCHSSRKLLTYVHILDAIREIERDAERQLGSQRQDYSLGAAQPTQAIKRGVKIKIVPRLAGCIVSPPFLQLTWSASWHRADFQLEPEPEFNESHVAGSVSFYVGPVLIAEVGIQSQISAAAPDSTVQRASASSYSSIFVSYSHRDTEIVKALEKAYSVLGFKYLRDVQMLRSGEGWNHALLRRIEEADVFQLCWSKEARESRYVEREWRHALKQQRTNFIRPVYWELPLPIPPVELETIHFAFLDLGGRARLLRRIKKWFRQILRP